MPPVGRRWPAVSPAAPGAAALLQLAVLSAQSLEGSAALISENLILPAARERVANPDPRVLEIAQGVRRAVASPKS
eukprot:14105446-Alexandrium_andersonii.AAC.1